VDIDSISPLLFIIDQHGQGRQNVVVQSFVITLDIGRDTTAQALSWMFYLLHRSATNKDILPKLVSEIDSSLGDKSPTYEVLKQMKYAEAW
jgi:hypothetical protein